MDNISEKTLRILIVIFGLFFCFTAIMWSKKEQELKNKNIAIQHLNKKIDSLNSEIFVKDLVTGSYEIMWGILEEINKPLADSINNQVE